MALFKKNNLPGIIFIILFFSGSFIFFELFFRYHLFFIEQLQAFLMTFDHFLGYFAKPAFLSSYLGDFLTQFYYLNWGGATVITVTLVIFWFTVNLLLKKISKNDFPFLLPLLPVAFSWIALCNPEFPVSNVISLIISVIFTLIYVSILSQKFRIIYGAVLVILLYVFAGSSVYVFTITAVFFEIFRTGNPHNITTRILNAAILFGVTIFIPLDLRDKYLLTKVQAFSYLSEMTKNPGFVQYLPGIILILTVLLAFLPFKKNDRQINSSFSTAGQIIGLTVLIFSGIMLTADFKREKILRLDYEATNGQWGKVYDLSQKFEMRNNIAAYYSNMALSNLGVMPDELMEHYQPAATGLFIPVDADENYLTITLSNEIYWQLGDVNASQHSALLGTIFSPRSQNSRLLKRLVEINIVNGQYAVAGKFIGILEKTMFHRKWASDKRKYLFNESECAGAEWIANKRAIIPSKDLLKKSNEYVKTLRMLADNHPENQMAVDYLLCYHLLSKDIDSFEKDFRKYYSSERNILLPKVYQEGLLIGITSGKHSHEEYSEFRFSPEIVKSMAEYTKLFEENKGKGYALQEKFSKTYWFYYHFATMKTDEK
jgi:hypothetical protein